jgi:hypothetical protein
MEFLAILTSLWASLASLLSSIDWLSIAAFLAATGGLGLLGMVWRSRAALAAKLPWIGAALELLEVVGFSPTALRAWVLRRSWYRKGEAETSRLVKELCPSSKPPTTLTAFLFVLCSLTAHSMTTSCAGQLPESVCGVPTDRALPLAITLARSAVSLAISTCSPSCPDELLAASKVIEKSDASREQVCSAVDTARAVPCIQCAEHLDSISTLAGCEPVDAKP